MVLPFLLVSLYVLKHQGLAPRPVAIPVIVIILGLYVMTVSNLVKAFKGRLRVRSRHVLKRLYFAGEMQKENPMPLKSVYTIADYKEKSPVTMAENNAIKSVYMMTDLEGVAGVDDWDPRHARMRQRQKACMIAPRCNGC